MLLLKTLTCLGSSSGNIDMPGSLSTSLLKKELLIVPIFPCISYAKCFFLITQIWSLYFLWNKNIPKGMVGLYSGNATSCWNSRILSQIKTKMEASWNYRFLLTYYIILIATYLLSFFLIILTHWVYSKCSVYNKYQ